MALEHLGVEVVGLVHVEVRHDVLCLLGLQHLLLKRDVVEVLVVFLVFEVVDNRHLRRIVLE